eukprot:PhM_4_TR7726/c0_g1_i1/m.46993/K07767/KATNA1; katanin p60 ATPase-containing subunit A1
MSTLQSLKVNSAAKEEEEKTKIRRKRGAIMLALDFLMSCGYTMTAQALQQESGMSVSKYTIADNMSLMTVITQFEEHYRGMYGTTPKYYRGLDPNEVGMPPSATPGTGRTQSAEGAPSSRPPRSNSGVSKPVKERNPTNNPLAPQTPPADDGLGVGGVGIQAAGAPAVSRRAAVNAQNSNGNATSPPPQGAARQEDATDRGIISTARILKPLPRFPTEELTELSQMIQRDILEQNPNVSWDDIVELDDAKQLLKEAVVFPFKYPQLFSGLLRPWRGILLFGPPGTGKTMLAKAIATECNTTFFNISASTIVSKWRGDSEKLVRMLFDLARYYAPSTIFVDEIDSVMSKRSSGGNEHEGSRRMKTELLIQMDGLARQNDAQVFVLAASNIPWDLDPALLRRLEKRICVRLPSTSARAHMFKKQLSPKYTDPNGDLDYRSLATHTNGYSGADIEVVCRESLMRKVRSIMTKIDNNAGTMLNDHAISLLMRVQQRDVDEAIGCTKSSCRSMDPIMYDKWEAEFGSGMARDDDDEQNTSSSNEKKSAPPYTTTE